MRIVRQILAAALPALIVTTPIIAQQPAFRDPSLPVDQRVADLLARMTLQEKFWQLYMSPGSLDDPGHDYSHGAFGLQIGTAPDAVDNDDPAVTARSHAERINAVQRYFVEQTRLGVPIIAFDEVLHGLMREGATIFPQAIALAATWDSALVARVATAIARETRHRGVRQGLSPVVNLATDARWGRTEETWGEDPFLTSKLGTAFVAQFERAGVITTPKHFVANVGDGGRDSYPVDPGERTLAEYHFPPFLAAIRDGGARSVMTAYNSVGGLPATQNPYLLRETLRDQWRFPGFVISDAAATGGATVLHMTEPSTPVAAMHAWQAGLDVVFQSTWEQHRPYLAAVERGLVSQQVIDSAVARVLRAKFELGLFERPYASPDSAAYWSAANPGTISLAREAAVSSIVMLQNDGVLPLASDARRIAVIGTDAIEARPGGYSGARQLRTSILSGIESAANRRGGEVLFAPGVPRIDSLVTVVDARALSHHTDSGSAPGLRAEYYQGISLSGEPAMSRIDSRLDFSWTLYGPAVSLPRDWYSARWHGRLTVPDAGVVRIGIRGNDGYRLWLDDSLLVDRWTKVSAGEITTPVQLAPGSTHDIRVEFHETSGNGKVALVWQTGDAVGPGAAIDSAAAVAATSDVAIVVAGIEEGEFRDRSSLRLPGSQEQMIRAVAATGTPVVVVLVGGGAVITSPWLDSVAAVLTAWYPGDAGGDAVADVLFGAADPGGRLPLTWPLDEGQLPLVYNHKPTGRGDDYLDLSGEPAFPFGHGLSFTSFEYSDLRISPDTVAVGDTVTVTVRVRNVGDRVGDEVVQLYVNDLLATVVRPVMELKGFKRIRNLAPGETVDLSIPIPVDRLAFPDRDMNWAVEPGDFRVLVGSSARNLRLRGTLTVRP